MKGYLHRHREKLMNAPPHCHGFPLAASLPLMTTSGTGGLLHLGVHLPFTSTGVMGSHYCKLVALAFLRFPFVMNGMLSLE